MGTSRSSSDGMFSQLIDQGCYEESSCRTDVQHREPTVRYPRQSEPGPYRHATICLAALCAVLLISIIAITAHYKSKSPTGGEAATTEMQKDNGNFSATIALIAKLQKENKELQKEKDELQANLTAVMRSTVVPPTPKATRATVVCPTAWQLFDNSCYLISTHSKSWSDSQKYCQGQGAHLAIILTAEEQTFLWNLLPRGHWNSYWFGVSDEDTEDEWKWVDGTPLVGGFWEENEPNNHIDEDCGYIVKTQVLERVATKSWFDAPCHMNLPFICEIASTTQ